MSELIYFEKTVKSRKKSRKIVNNMSVVRSPSSQFELKSQARETDFYYHLTSLGLGCRPILISMYLSTCLTETIDASSNQHELFTKFVKNVC